MKKILALALAVLTVFGTVLMSGCGKKDDEDKGAVIQMFLGSLPTNLDPTAVEYGNADNGKIFGLLYEGLFTIDEKGKVKDALADEYEYYVDARDNTLKLEITLKGTKWSDGIPVDADDFVYSWQRLLNPATENSAAALLYPIKNAKNVKEGLCSINDLGICAVSDNVLQIAFEKDFTNVEYFVRRLASPVLVPLREDNATKFDDAANSDYVWDATKTKSLPLTNGPFKYKICDKDRILIERSIHYNNVSSNSDNAPDKEVTPYQLVTLLSNGKNADEQIERYNNGEIFYINLSEASEKSIDSVKNVKTDEIPSVYTYFFDTTSDLFSDAKVRKALSIALDREHINSLTGRDTKAAEGIIPFGVDDTVEKTEFRDEAEEMFAPKGDMEAAKTLLKEAGVKKGESITLEYNKDRDYEADIAKYAKKVWEELGFKVKASATGYTRIYGIASGKVKFAEGQNKIIGMDFQCVTPDAYSMLMEFSPKYAGGKIDLLKEKVEYENYSITGYESEEYTAVCDEIVGALNNDARAEAMHKAEEILVNDSPVIPLFCNVDIYASKGLKKVKNDDFGARNFIDVSQNNYKKHLPKE